MIFFKYNHHQERAREPLQFPRRFPCTLSQLILPKDDSYYGFYHHRQAFFVNRILWHRLFCAWLLLLYIIPVQTLISVMCGNIHSFSLLHIIPLCECITICPFYCWWVTFPPVWSYEHFTAGTTIIFVHSFSWKQPSFFLDMYPGVDLLGHRVGIYLALAVLSISKWTCCFTLHESSHGGRALSPFDFARALISAILVWVQ